MIIHVYTLVYCLIKSGSIEFFGVSFFARSRKVLLFGRLGRFWMKAIIVKFSRSPWEANLYAPGAIDVAAALAWWQPPAMQRLGFRPEGCEVLFFPKVPSFYGRYPNCVAKELCSIHPTYLLFLEATVTATIVRNQEICKFWCCRLFSFVKKPDALFMGLFVKTNYAPNFK